MDASRHDSDRQKDEASYHTVHPIEKQRPEAGHSRL